MTRKLQNKIIGWDVKNWSKALDYWGEHIKWDTVQNCLELGGREGGLSLWLALEGKQVVCSDIGDVKQTVGKLHDSYFVADRITYQQIDATRIPYENHFDLIVFKSILGIIGINDDSCKQQKAIAEMYKALKPGGQLVFAENLSGSPLHRMLRKKFVKWGSVWRYITVEEMKRYLQDFRTYSLKSTGFAGVFGRNETQRNLLATLDQTIINFFVPNSWKYIVYGVAEK
jgi:SAM-dependent methyltransferase